MHHARYVEIGILKEKEEEEGEGGGGKNDCLAIKSGNNSSNCHSSQNSVIGIFSLSSNLLVH